MSRFQLMQERTTRSVVFEGEVVRLLEQYAAARQRSLSSVVREAVARFLEDGTNTASSPRPANGTGPAPLGRRTPWVQEPSEEVGTHAKG